MMCSGRAEELVRLSFGVADAAHLAFAEFYGAEFVTCDELADYLLSRTHLIGRWKARFFLSIGFRETRIDELKDALIDVAKKGEVKSKITTEFGVKYPAYPL
jgi:hypothetical protein